VFIAEGSKWRESSGLPKPGSNLWCRPTQATPDDPLVGTMFLHERTAAPTFRANMRAAHRSCKSRRGIGEQVRPT
jgi:hypothetical protein